MRILYLSRVFSGFETSLTRRFWQPTGVPTIYKIMETFDQSDHKICFLMACRGIGSDYRTEWNRSDDRTINMEGLRHPVKVLASENRYPKWFGCFRGPLTTLRHLLYIMKVAVCFRPHFAYVDRSNVIAGAVFSHLFRIPVILRVMGVYPSMWDTLSQHSLAARVTRWAYRAPFALVICTQDGSGGELWLPQALRPGVPFRMLLNGCAEPITNSVLNPHLEGLPKDRIIVLFVGRFETIKGCQEFVEAVLILHAHGRDDIHAVMIGTGQLYDSIRTRVRTAGAEDIFTFIQRLPHDQIAEAHKRSHIYVSLNRLGQLSNANLEAISMGACMIIPESQPDRAIDVATEQLLDTQAVVRIPWENQAEVLADVIGSLAENPDRRSRLQSNIQATATAQIQSWDRRVAHELELISKHTGCLV